MKQTIKQGNTYNAGQYILKVTYINDIYFYGTASDQYNKSHWQTGHIYKNNHGDEEMQLSFYNSKEMYEFTEAQVKSIVDGWASEAENKRKAKAEQIAKEKRIAELNSGMYDMVIEAKDLRDSLYMELNSMGYGAKSLTNLLKDEKFKTALAKYNAVSDFLHFNFNAQRLPSA